MRDGTRTFLPYRVKLWLAGLVLAWERFLPAFRWPLAMTGLFLGLSLMEIPQALGAGAPGGGWMQAAFLVLFPGIFLVSLFDGAKRFSWPGRDAVLRRLESRSGLRHRPLSAINDRAAGDGQMESALWQAYLQRLGDVRARVRVGAPAPVAAGADPFGARAIIGLLLVIGIAVGWQNPGERLRAALLPDLGGSGGTVSLADVWISPPEYTGKPPFLLSRSVTQAEDRAGSGSETVIIPRGSRFLATVNGGTEPPLLVIDNATAENAAPTGQNTASRNTTSLTFGTIAPQSHRIETPVDRGTGIAIMQDGEILATWQITILPDLAPTVSFPEAPSASARQALVLPYEAEDDYGVVTVTARIHRLEDGTATGEAPIEIIMPAISGDPRKVSGQNFSDLTPHPWAGHEVRITLAATDAIGQTGRGDAVDMVLPERVFTHPVARAVIEQRKHLVRAPEDRMEISGALYALAIRPEHYYDDKVVFLGLNAAARRLRHDLAEGASGGASGGAAWDDAGNSAGNSADGAPDSELLDEVQRLLWDIALRIEDGDVSTALRTLREAERRLQEALAGDASDEEIGRLMDEMRRAMDEYLRAMAEQMMEQARRGENTQQQQIDPQQMLRREDLMQQLDRMRDLARTGARDAARQMLSQLQQMMENLRMGMQQQQMSPQQQAVQEMMRQLNELTQQQRQLMDRTFREGQRQRAQTPGQQPRAGREGQQPGPRQQNGQQQPGQQQGGQQGNGGMSAEELAARLGEMQERLRRELGEFMRRVGEGLGEIPEDFGAAEQSMRNAEQALGQNAPGEATGSQGDALDRMRQGAASLNEALRRMSEGQNGEGGPGAETAGDDDIDYDDGDPLNRRRTGRGVNTGSDVEIPAETDIQRARRIFDELRERSGDRSRPALELDYIDRLLKRF